METSSRTATAVGLLAIIFWGTSVGMIRSVTELLGPTAGSAVLYSASAVLLAFTRRTPLKAFPPKYLLVGSCLFVAYEVCFALALGMAKTRTTAIEVGMVNYLWPTLTVLAASIFGRERVGPLMLLGLAVSLAGVVVCSSGEHGFSFAAFLHHAADNPASYALAFAGAVVWALYCVSTRLMSQGRDGLWLFMGLGALAFWVLHMLKGASIPMEGASLTTAAVVACAATAGTLGYACWNVGIQRGNMNLLALAANAAPLLSAAFASLMLATPLTLPFWMGAALIAAGSVTGFFGSRKESRT